MTQQLQTILDAAWEDRANISTSSASQEVRDAVEHVISQLNNGSLRVATRQSVGQWTTHQWIKKAVLLSFRLKDNSVIKAGEPLNKDVVSGCGHSKFLREHANLKVVLFRI